MAKKTTKNHKRTTPGQDIAVRMGPNGREVYDLLRKRFVALTPEEWVRQTFVHYLIDVHKFPPGLMGNEVSLNQNGIKRRCDTVVADRYGQPLVIVEYKSPTVTLSQSTFDQIVRYNMTLRARYLFVTNGLHRYCCRIDYENNSYEYLVDIPDYDDL